MDVERLRERQAVFMWQGNPNLHPLTCGNNSDHELTYDLMFDRGLFCPVCDWTQEAIPQAILDAFDDVVRACGTVTDEAEVVPELVELFSKPSQIPSTEMVEAAARKIRGLIGDDLIDEDYCKIVAEGALLAAFRVETGEQE